MELDRISNLPSDVLEQILSRLHIKEAVKTSVLSSKWRYKAATLPHLVLDDLDKCFSTQNCLSFKNIVSQVLFRHIGPIKTFNLRSGYCVDYPGILQWTLHLSRNPIEELALKVWTEAGPYEMPSCFFSCQNLIGLELSCCLLKPPSTFKGFKRLKSVYLLQVTITQDVLESLIVCCPLLERLALKYCNGFTHLKIDAPNLQFYDLEGSFVHFNFENTLNLAEVYILFDGGNRSWVPDRFSSHLVKFFAHLPRIRRLSVQYFLFEYLAHGASPVRLPNPLLYLDFLFIHICFCRPREVSTAQCLLRSSPALRELKILNYNGAEAGAQEVNSSLDDNQSCPFTQLRLVKISGISGSKAELDFIRFLLSNSPVLEKMTVEPARVAGPSKLREDLLQIRPASANAEIIYVEYWMK